MPSKRRPARGVRLPCGIRYSVWYTGQVKKAPAREILAAIQKSGQASGELRSMSATQYARALVDDAAYFLPRKLLAYFQQQEYPTEFDRALEYLAAMPTSGVRILVREPHDDTEHVENKR